MNGSVIKLSKIPNTLLTPLRYSPTSACRNTTIPVGSVDREAEELFAEMPKPYEFLRNGRGNLGI